MPLNGTVVGWLPFFLSVLFFDRLPEKKELFIITNQVEVKKIVHFKARLIKAPSAYPKCGDDKVAISFRFHVVDRVKQSEQDIVVIFPCPEQFGEGNFFSEGDVFSITASRDLSEQKQYTVINNFEAAKLETLWGITIAKQRRKISSKK
jgi:hypothetical protein